MAHMEQRNFCEWVKTRFPDDFRKKRVLDVGSLDINGNNRYLFNNCDYIGIDLESGKNVDIICSAHKFKGQYDTIISTEAFEHDEHVQESLNNIVSNLLKPGGLFIFTCASEGRPEHGTAKHKSYDSPSTNDYYKNLSEKDIRELIDIDYFFGNNFKFAQNFQTKDLYFAGRKTPNSDLLFWEQPKVSIIIPVIRPEKAKRCIKMIHDNAGIDDKYYEIITEEDNERIGAPLMIKKLVVKAQYNLVCFLGDDALPQPDFLKNAMKAMNNFPNRWGLVGFNDNTGRTLATHWIADKRLLSYLDGEFFHTGYKHCFCDNELQERVTILNRYIYAIDAIVLHDHPLLMHTKSDKDYERVYSKEYMNHDRNLFEQRCHLWREQNKDIIISKQDNLPFWKQPKVSIIIPVIRPKEAKRCISAIKKNIGLPIDQYEIVSEMDTQQAGCPKMVKKLTEKAKYDLVMFLGDDTIPEPDFMRHALDTMESLPDGWGIVGLNTKGPVSTDFTDNSPKNSNPYAHWLAHKKILKHIPGEAFFSIEYKHSYGDAELKEIAEELGRWAFAEGARIDHIHPINQSAPDDKHYQRAYSEENAIHDKRTYCTRKRARMQKKYGIKLAIAMPLIDDKVYNQFFFSFIKVITEYMSSLVKKGKPISFDVLMPDFPCQVDAARNNLVNQAMLLGCTHILMMDTDQIYATTDMIDKMLAHNKPVVGARVHRRYPPFDPLLLRGNVGKLYQVPNNEVKNEDGTFETELDVTYTGTGCILYDTQIFIDMIPDKWFQFKIGDAGQPIGEDIVFCEKLRDRKIPIIVDCSIDIKHLTLMAADWGTYKLFSKMMGGKNHGIRK